MDITINKNGSEMNIAISGKLDTHTAPEAEKKIMEEFDGVDKVVIDCAALAYVTSAGIRLLLVMLQKLPGKESLVLKNVNSEVVDVLSLVGIDDDLTIE